MSTPRGGLLDKPSPFSANFQKHEFEIFVTIVAYFAIYGILPNLSIHKNPLQRIRKLLRKINRLELVQLLLTLACSNTYKKIDRFVWQNKTYSQDLNFILFA